MIKKHSLKLVEHRYMVLIEEIRMVARYQLDRAGSLWIILITMKCEFIENVRLLCLLVRHDLYSWLLAIL